MKNSGTRTRSTLELAAFLLVLVAALGAQAEPPSSTLPGRKPDSKEPWGAFLGKAAHTAIGRAYSVQHPTHFVFLDTASLADIVEEELPREEIEQRGELAEQAIRAAYEGGERPRGFEGQVYLPVDCR